MKVLVSYDNTLVPYTTGNYFLEAFGEVADAMHCLPQELGDVDPSDFDLFIKIDDGISYHKWRVDLHPSVYYVIDSHMDMESWREDLIKEGEFDLICTAQKNAVEKYKDLGDAHWVPLGCDPRKHSPRDKSMEKVYDTCFIGNLHSPYAGRRIDYLDRLFKEVPDFFYGTRAWQDMADKFWQSKIVFNHALNNDINMRYFEACCSGSFQLASRIHDNGFEDLFDEDRDLVCYDSEEEMVDKVNFYLKNPYKREEIARNGMERVCAFHTYEDRAKKILRIAKSCELIS